jgi:hypothetical protein
LRCRFTWKSNALASPCAFHRAADGTLVTTRSIGSAYEVEQHDGAEGGSLVQFALRRMAEIPALAAHLAKAAVPAPC